MIKEKLRFNYLRKGMGTDKILNRNRKYTIKLHETEPELILLTDIIDQSKKKTVFIKYSKKPTNPIEKPFSSIPSFTVSDKFLTLNPHSP
jgi:hypothetical protein